MINDDDADFCNTSFVKSYPTDMDKVSSKEWWPSCDRQMHPLIRESWTIDRRLEFTSMINQAGIVILAKKGKSNIVKTMMWYSDQCVSISMQEYDVCCSPPGLGHEYCSRCKHCNSTRKYATISFPFPFFSTILGQCTLSILCHIWSCRGPSVLACS